ncbi:unnamed protein product [Pseudo-nitzschia multistriata]|uniref:Peptidase A1 domain-containing protein n=1 Tax=Pseudo-nitzschia multistriata TaxID=183589 RepID=A0A448Z278_9STRA|nr:unnamed protein product [Pseudo-nitzschia multistriata]
MATKTKTRTRTNAKPNAAPKTAMATPLLSAVLLAVLGRHASAAAGGGSPPYPGRVLSGGPGGSVTFPLVPHHVQAARRGLSGEEPPAGERRRRRRVAEDANAKGVTKDPEQMGVLYMGYGTHYADLWVGTPPQRQTVIVDTGSAQTAFPCGGCKDCGFPQHHLSAYFEEALSSTFEKAVCDDCTRKATCNTQKDRCEIEQYYTEGSAWEAYEANDTVYAGGFHGKALLEEQGGTSDDLDPSHAAALGFPLRFGCQTMVTGLFKTQLADGIMGMCDGKNAFWHQMYRAGKIHSKQFSLCFSRPPHSSREGTLAGAMTLGGTDERLHHHPMVYTTTRGTPSMLPRRKKSGYFDVHVRKMYLRAGSGGESAATADPSAIVLELSGAELINELGGVIVDSGTTDSYFSSAIQMSLRENYKTLTGGASSFHHDKVSLTGEELAALPTLLIQMAGDEALNRAVAEEHGGPAGVPGLAGDLDPEHPLDVIVAVPPSHYMEHLSTGRYQNRIYATEKYPDGSVLGANTMMGHDILFDPTQNRIGWAESSCDYHELATKHGFPDVLGDELQTAETKEAIATEEEEEEDQVEAKEAFDVDHVEAEIQEEEAVAVAAGAEHQQHEQHNNDDEQGNDGPAGDTPEEPTAPSLRPADASKSSTAYIAEGPEGPQTALLALGLLLAVCAVCGCLYRRCCPRGPPARAAYHRAPEIELNGRSSYKDGFGDEDLEEEDDDVADEYGDKYE